MIAHEHIDTSPCGARTNAEFWEKVCSGCARGERSCGRIGGLVDNGGDQRRKIDLVCTGFAAFLRSIADKAPEDACSWGNKNTWRSKEVLAAEEARRAAAAAAAEAAAAAASPDKPEEAAKPEGWDDEEDGEWEAETTISSEEPYVSSALEAAAAAELKAAYPHPRDATDPYSEYTLDPHPGCADLDARCGRWAQTGECQKNPGYLLRHCHRSCEMCEHVEAFPDLYTPNISKVDARYQINV